MNKGNLKVALLYGGDSSERQISIKTGKAVENALKNLGYDYKVFDPIEKQKFISDILKYNPDVAFIALHGKGGEDGQIQAILDFFGIRYTGSGSKTSAICMDKKLTKDILKNYSIPVPEDYTLEDIKFPVVLKPSEEGSSIGVHIVFNKSQLEKALQDLKNYENILIEEYIKGRELTVSILNDKVLPIIEIKVKNGFYDYENKYFSNETKYICPAKLPFVVEEKVKAYAKRAYNILKCKGAVRVDFILSEDDTPYLLEINTVPGMTEHSLLPKSAKAIGYTFEQLVNEIIVGALNEKK